jgi:hypothetical protein
VSSSGENSVEFGKMYDYLTEFMAMVKKVTENLKLFRGVAEGNSFQSREDVPKPDTVRNHKECFALVKWFD